MRECLEKQDQQRMIPQKIIMHGSAVNGTNDVSEIAVCVMIEKAGAGGIVAAPVAGQIFDYYFSR